MSFNTIFLPLHITIFLIFICVIPVFTQEVSANEAASNGNEKPAIILVPLGGEDVPSYIPMIVDRLFEAKLDKTEAYAIFTREELAAILKENGITLPDNITDETARKIGERLGMDHVLYGSINLDGSDFVINSKIMDVETGTVISEDMERAQNIKGLEEAVGKLTRSIVQTVLPPEAVAAAVQTLDAAEQTDKEADVQESISAFEKLAEEDPQQALEMVGEPAREAIKESVREEIVEEEIQNLYDQEVAEQAALKKRKKQLRRTLLLEGAAQAGNIFGAMAVQQRVLSLKYWDIYMNDGWTYDLYQDKYRFYRLLELNSILFGGIGNLGLAATHLYYPDDILSFSGFGRKVYTYSYLTTILGNFVSVFADSQSLLTQHKFLEYLHTTVNFTDYYEAYRDANNISSIAKLSSYALWGLGYSGMLFSYIFRDGDIPLIPSAKAKRLLTIGTGLLGLGNFTAGAAVNYYAQAEEFWINENSPSGGIGDSPADAKYTISDIVKYTSYALYLGSGVLTWYALSLPSGADDSSIGEDSVTFNIVPSSMGIGAVVRLRM